MLIEDTERRIQELRREADRLEREKKTVDSLPPCPFCGGKPRISEIKPAWGLSYPEDSRFSVVCTGCGCGTKEYKNKDDAAWSWRRRTGG